MGVIQFRTNHRQWVKNRIRQIWGDLDNREIASYDNTRNSFFKAVRRKYGLSRAQVMEVLCEIEDQCDTAA